VCLIQARWHVPYAVVYLTGACNLGCSYCFANRLPPRHMSRRTGERVVEWLFENSRDGKEDPLILSFFGGEPLLRFSILRCMVEFSDRLSDRYGKRIVFSVTTNGTLITGEILDFLEARQIAVLFSVDGDRRTNDMHRNFKNGSSAAETIYAGARSVLERFPKVAARMTVTRDNLHRLADNIRFLHRLGFRFISPCPALETITGHKAWEEFDRQCRRAAEYVIRNALDGDYLHLHFLDNGIDQLVHKRAVDVACGAGKTIVGIDTNGDIYPCHRFVSYAPNDGKRFRLGNIHDGIDPVRALPFRRYDRSNVLGCYTRCRECPANDFCAGGCIALYHETTGNFLAPLVQQQKLMSVWQEICAETVDCFKQRGKFAFLLEQIKLKPKSFLPLRIYLKTGLSDFPAPGYSPPGFVSKEDQGWLIEAGSDGESRKNWESFGRFQTRCGNESDPSWRNTGRRRPRGASTPSGGSASTA